MIDTEGVDGMTEQEDRTLCAECRRRAPIEDGDKRFEFLTLDLHEIKWGVELGVDEVIGIRCPSHTQYDAPVWMRPKIAEALDYTFEVTEAGASAGWTGFGCSCGEQQEVNGQGASQSLAEHLSRCSWNLELARFGQIHRRDGTVPALFVGKGLLLFRIEDR